MSIFSSVPPDQLIGELTTGYVLSGALAAAAKLGIADQLAHGPQSAASLGEALGVHARSLQRVLQLLASVGVFTQDEAGRFGQTVASEQLRSGAANSLHDYVLLMTQGVFWVPVGELCSAIQTGATPFARIFGRPFFDYLAHDKDATETYYRGLSTGCVPRDRMLAQSYDFRPFRRIVDVGGGSGEFLHAVLALAPEARGVLFDRHDVIEVARGAGALPDRCECIEGNFLETVPPGGDVYLLKQILHNWTDEACVAVLRNCRRAMVPGGRVLIIDSVLRPDRYGHVIGALDVMMMAAMAGGERTEEELRQLLARAGFSLAQLIDTPVGFTIVEAVASSEGNLNDC